MKIGDLVILSAYGRKLRCNNEFTDSVGVVVSVDVRPGRPLHRCTAINVLWASVQNRKTYQIRADLKFAK
jgi:hypothetical protein